MSEDSRQAEPELAARPDIVGIGVSVLDTVMVVDRFPNQETVTRATARSVGLGGGVSVAMATAAAMGERTAMVDRLGRDEFSHSIVSAMKDAGVATQWIKRCDDITASVASIWTASDFGSRTIVFSPGQNIDLAWSPELETVVASAKVLHLNGRHLAASRQAVDIATAKHVTISYDGGAHRYRDEVLPLVARANVLIVAEQFAQACLGSDSTDAAKLCAELFAKFDAQIVGVTCGTRGSWFQSAPNDRAAQADCWQQPAFEAAKTVDTTGCGDVFHGAFLAGLVRGDSLRRCSELASQAAALNAAQLGAFSASAQLQFARLRADD